MAQPDTVAVVLPQDVADDGAGDLGSGAGGHGHGHGIGLVQGPYGNGPDAQIHVFLLHDVAVHVLVILGRADDGHFRSGGGFRPGFHEIIHEAEFLGGDAPDPFDVFHHILVLVQLGQFCPRNAQVRCLDEHHRVGAVDHGDFGFTVPGYVDGLFLQAGGEQFAGLGPGRVFEVHVNPGTGARYALDAGVPVDAGHAVLHPHMFFDDLVGVHVVHPYLRDAFHRFHQAFVDGVGTHRRRDVAAVGGIIHPGDHDIHLEEVVIHVDAGPVGFADHGHLGGGAYCAAHAVDLFHIRGPHDLQEDVLPFAFVRRQIFFVEEHRFAGAAAHIYTGEFPLFLVHADCLLQACHPFLS